MSENKSSIKEIIIHIGMPKTATTSIQQSLYENKEALLRIGYLYPLVKSKNIIQRVEYYGINHVKLIKDLIDDNKPSIQKKYTKLIKKEINKYQPEKIIISAEILFRKDTKIMKSLLDMLYSTVGDHVKIKLICFVRDPIAWSVSATQQTLKYPALNSKSNKYSKVMGAGIKILDTYLNMFGEIEVYKFEDAVYYKKGVLDFFYNKIGINNTSDFIKVGIENESLSLEAGCLLQYIERAVPTYVNEKINVSNGRIKGDTDILFGINGEIFNLPNNLKRRINEKTINYRNYLCESFGIEYESKLFEREENNVYLSENTIREIKSLFPKMTNTIKELSIGFINEYKNKNIFDLLREKENHLYKDDYIEIQSTPNYFKYIKNHNLSHIEEVIIHIGMHKTGTTSIQQTLHKNYNELLSNGFYFPNNWQPNNMYNLSVFVLEDMYSYAAYREHNMSDSDIRKFQRKTTKMLLNNLKDENIKRVIFSAERLEAIKPSEVLLLKKFIQKIFDSKTKITIVMATRSPINIITSATQQRLKGRGVFFSDYNFNNRYSGSIIKYFKAFENANFVLYKFEESLKHEYGPVGFFLEKIGYPRKNLNKIEYVRSNSSICQELYDMLLYINIKKPYSNNYKRADGINLEQGRSLYDSRILDDLTGEKFGIDNDTKRYYHNVTYKSTKWLKENTGIDYLDTYNFEPLPEAFCKQLEDIYPELTPKIKELVDEYLVINGGKPIGKVKEV